MSKILKTCHYIYKIQIFERVKPNTEQNHACCANSDDSL